MKQPINQAIQDALTEIMSPNMQQQWAAAAMRPGIALVRAVLDLIEQQIGSAAPAQIPAKRGRPAKAATAAAPRKYRSTGWPEDPEERKLEMIRRRQKAIENNGGKPIHPQNPNHPKHAAWVKKMRKLAKERMAAGGFAAKIPRARLVNGAENVA